ncbi:unnamed protein product [Linum trigynum]|uniref:Uncharacterized protein n=1 Tax=Linum trigynum TaxID=586398 RepID=A0AAV2DE42_9ROSI
MAYGLPRIPLASLLVLAPVLVAAAAQFEEGGIAGAAAELEQEFINFQGEMLPNEHVVDNPFVVLVYPCLTVSLSWQRRSKKRNRRRPYFQPNLDRQRKERLATPVRK